MSQRVLPENNAPKLRTSEEARECKRKKQHTHTTFDHKISQRESESANLKQLISLRRLSPRWKRCRRRRGKNALQFARANSMCVPRRARGERRECQQIVFTSVSHKIEMACIRIWAAERTKCSRFRMKISSRVVVLQRRAKKRVGGGTMTRRVEFDSVHLLQCVCKIWTHWLSIVISLRRWQSQLAEVATATQTTLNLALSLRLKSENSNTAIKVQMGGSEENW